MLYGKCLWKNGTYNKDGQNKTIEGMRHRANEKKEKRKQCILQKRKRISLVSRALNCEQVH